MPTATRDRPLDDELLPAPPGAGDIAIPSTGTITSATPSTTDRVVWNNPGGGESSVQITGTWTATLQFEATNDPVGGTFFAVKAMNISTDAVVTSTNANGTFVVPGGYVRYQLRASAYTSGTVIPFIFASESPNVVRVIASTSGGAAMTVPDGGDVNQGSTTDAAVVTDANATMSSKLRGLVKIFADVWDSVNHVFRVSGTGSFTTVGNKTNNNAAPGANNIGALTGLANANDPTWVEGNLALQSADLRGRTRTIASGYTTVISATLTRPANTTAYTAGDEVSNSATAPTITTLTGIARFSGGSGVIQGIYVSFSSNWATKPTLRLWFYDTTSTPQNDNTAFAPSDAEQDTAIGYIDLTASAVADATGSTGNFGMDTGPISFPFLTVGSANLFMRVQITNAGQAGANSDTLKFRVRALCD